MPAIIAWQAIQRHIDCQKRNGVSGPVASRIEREALILILPPAIAVGASAEHQGGAFVLPGWHARSAKRPKPLPGTSCKRSTSTRTADQGSGGCSRGSKASRCQRSYTP